MTVKKPSLNGTISFGNMLNLVVLIAGIAGGYVMLQARAEQNTTDIQEVQEDMETGLQQTYTRLEGFGVRLRGLEIRSGRDDERFTNILQFMSRIDARLDRIEQQQSDINVNR